MKLYEYQAKSLFRSSGIPTPEGAVFDRTSDLPLLLKRLGRGPWALKAQILAGGRGKAGGIKITSNPKEAKQFSTHLLGKTLITNQTGPRGERVGALYVEKSIPKISKELYAAVLIDRSIGKPVLLASREGGMDIEVLARERPESLIKVVIEPDRKFPQFEGRDIAHQLGLKGTSINAAGTLLSKLVDVFFKTDAMLVEINPLALLENGTLMALDGKISTDDNALFRHADQAIARTKAPMPAAEKKAAKANISYIKLEGNVGCLVNGAGLAMATMDLIKFHGGEPANFLDVGGGANESQVTEAFKIILSDKKVKGVLVNIFGGIMRCDVIANGIVAAVREVKLKVPLVVRLEGNKSDEGKNILKKSKLPIVPATNLSEAAAQIVKEVQKI